MTTLFNLQSASVQFGQVHALADCSMRIAAGERLALIGSNGSGKSTLLRLLHGLLKPSTGSVSADASARQAMLFQRPYMLRATVQNNIALSLWLRGFDWQQARQDALAALARVGLAELSGRNAKALSGGQQQRVALARARFNRTAAGAGLGLQTSGCIARRANLKPGPHRQARGRAPDGRVCRERHDSDLQQPQSGAGQALGQPGGVPGAWPRRG